MTKLFKRAAAGVMALAMCAGLTGCYSENNTWAAKMGDTTLPIGGYIYYLSSAYSEAAGRVGTESEVLKADIDGKAGSQWVSDKAMDYLYSYYFVEQKFDELGLTLDEEDQDSIDTVTASMWSGTAYMAGYKDAFEKMGIAESSFKQAYAVYNTKLSKVLQAMYGKGGEMEVSDDELHDYYTGDYIYYQYLSVDLTTTNEDGESVDMEDEEKSEIKEYLEDQAELVSGGRIELDTASANYANFKGAEPTLSEPSAYRADNLSAVFADALEPLKNGEAAFLETATRYYIVQRLDVEDDFKALMEDESRLSGLLSEMKLEEFSDYAIEQGRSLDVQVNTGALRKVSISKVVDLMGKNGTSSASSESSESSGSSESSSESSDAE